MDSVKTSKMEIVGVVILVLLAMNVIQSLLAQCSMHIPGASSGFLKKVGRRRKKRSKGYRLNTSDMKFEDDTRGKTIQMNLPPTHMLANGERRMNPSVLNSASGILGADQVIME
jgi:hypothetical protein